MLVPILVVESCSQRWAWLRGLLADRGYEALSVRTGREAAAVVDAAHVSVLVVSAVGPIADHQPVLLCLEADSALGVVVMAEDFSPEVLTAYAQFGAQVAMAQTDPSEAVARMLPPDAPYRAA